MEKGIGKGLGTILGPGTEFEGSIIVPHSVRIDGKFRGKVTTDETLTVGPDGIIEADIKARSAIILGSVVGNLSTEDRVELATKASLVGDMKTRDLVIAEGAVFHGNCSMTSATGHQEKV